MAISAYGIKIKILEDFSVKYSDFSTSFKWVILNNGEDIEYKFVKWEPEYVNNVFSGYGFLYFTTNIDTVTSLPELNYDNFSLKMIVRKTDNHIYAEHIYGDSISIIDIDNYFVYSFIGNGITDYGQILLETDLSKIIITFIYSNAEKKNFIFHSINIENSKQSLLFIPFEHNGTESDLNLSIFSNVTEMHIFSGKDNELYSETGFNNNVAIGLSGNNKYYEYYDKNMDFNTLFGSIQNLKINVSGASGEYFDTILNNYNNEYKILSFENNKIKFVPQGYDGKSDIQPLYGDSMNIAVYDNLSKTNMKFSYVDFTINYPLSGSLDISCDLDVSEMIGENFVYKRKISIINNVDILFNNKNNYIVGDSERMSAKDICIKHVSDFDAQSYILCPYKLVLDEESMYIDGYNFNLNTGANSYGIVKTNLGDGVSLIKHPKKIANQNKDVKIYFDIEENNIPVNVFYEKLLVMYSKYQKSFNKINIWVKKTFFNSEPCYSLDDRETVWTDLSLKNDLLLISNIKSEDADNSNAVYEIIGYDKEKLYFKPLYLNNALSDIYSTASSVPVVRIIDIEWSMRINKYIGVKVYRDNTLTQNYYYNLDNDFFLYKTSSMIQSDIATSVDYLKSIGYTWFAVLSNTKNHNGVYRVCRIDFNSKIANKIFFTNINNNCDLIKDLSVSITSPTSYSNNIIEPLDENGISIYLYNLSDIYGGDDPSSYFTASKGDLQSFYNEMESVLTSSINGRNNLHAKQRYFNKYLYISKEDFVYEYDNSENNIKIDFGVKSFCNFKIKEKKVLDAVKDGYIDVEEYSIDYKNYYTSIQFNLNNPIFKQQLNGQYPVQFEIEDSFFDMNFGYASFSTDILKNGYMFAEINNVIYSYKIVSNTDRKVVISGKKYQELVKSTNIAFGFFHIRNIIVRNSTGENKIKYSLFPQNIINGVLYYNSINRNVINGKVNDLIVDFFGVNEELYLSKQISLS